MKKLILLFAIVLGVLGLRAESYTWTYNVTDDYKSPAWKNIPTSISPTSNTADAPITDVAWTKTGTAVGSKNGGTYQGLQYGTGTAPADVTFSTTSFAGKKITGVYILVASVSGKYRYDLIVKNGSYENTTADIIYSSGSTGAVNTPGEATLTPNTTADKFSFQLKSTGTTNNTKGGFKFCKISITYESSNGPVDFEPNFKDLDLKVGAVEEITLPADAPAVTFTSNDACVEVAGNVISADAEGTATITATWSANDKWKAGSATFTVNVSKNVYAPDWKDIVLEENASTTLELGTEHPEFAFESSDENVAMIDESTGEIVAVSAGTATITAIWGDNKWADGEKIFTVTVTKLLTEVTMSWPNANVSVNLGSEFTAQALTITPAEALAEVKYSSSKPEVAAFEEGKLVIKGAGTTTITAAISGSVTYKPASAEYTLTVVDPTAPVTFDFSTENAYGMTTQDSGSNYETAIKKITNGIVTLAFDGKYRSWSSTSGPELRIQDGATMKFTVPEGYEFVSISINRGASGQQYGFKITPEGTVTEVKDGNTTLGRLWKPAENTCYKEVTYTGTTTSRIGSIDVVIKECPMDIPLLVKDGNTVTVSAKHPTHAIAWRVLPYEDEPAESAPARAVAASEWTTLNVGENLTHQVDANESYYLEVKAVKGTKESEVIRMKMINGEVTGISDITVDSAEVEYYNLQGIRVINPENGIFIRRQGNKVTKVIL